MWKTAVASLSLFMLAGCANQQTMSRDDFITTTQRTYDGVSEREFYKAAETLFKLSDEDDTEFAYPGEHAMIVEHDWSLYMVLAAARGTHTWQIKTEPTDTGLTANAYVSLQAANMTGMPTGGGGASVMTSPSMQNMVNTPAIYELFWARMDYLLDKSQVWPTCEDWEAKVDRGESYGTLDPLCVAMNIDDLKPESAQ